MLEEMSFPRLDKKVLLPQLEHIIISLASIHYSFVEMVQSRQNGVAKELGPDRAIRSICFEAVQSTDEGAVDVLRSMNEDDLRVSIKYQ